MKNGRRNLLAAGLAALASRAAAQVASICPTTNVCFKLNIPQNTASSGNGDVFFQISAPSTYNYVALGQGNGMAGANIFVVYTSGNGNVTLSPRLGTGHFMPEFNRDAQVTLLEGSGVSGGKMVANVRCSSCNKWSGGSASFSGNNGNWIYATKQSGGAQDTTSQSANIDEHDDHATFRWDYANAKGGNSVNPLDSSGNSNPGNSNPGNSNPGNSNPGNSNPGGTGPGGASGGAAPTNSGFTPISTAADAQRTRKMLIAHGTLAALAFVIFFPFGSIAIRLASFTGVVWFHAAFQIFAYIIYVVAFGLGIYIANSSKLLSESHPIIGIVVFALLFFQPVFGFVHHIMYKKCQGRTVWSHLHLWLGRIAITLGIINGGLGLKLADRLGMGSKSGMIAYSVVAGVVWLAWVAAAIMGEKRRAKAVQYAERPSQSDAHYAPKENGS